MSTTTTCDICGKRIPPNDGDTSWGLHLKAGSKTSMGVTPRKKRLYVERIDGTSHAMLRVNIDLYVGECRGDDVHAHHECLQQAVTRHMVDTIGLGSDED